MPRTCSCTATRTGSSSRARMDASRSIRAPPDRVALTSFPAWRGSPLRTARPTWSSSRYEIERGRVRARRRAARHAPQPCVGDGLRACELRGKLVEPRGEQQQLVNLVRGNPRRIAFRLAVDVAGESRELLALGFAPGRLALGAHAAAPNEIDAVVMSVAGHGVHERQCFHRAAKVKELLLERLEPEELVAQRCRPLELHPAARGLHVAAQRRNGCIVRAIQKGTSQVEPLGVLVLRARGHARTQALAHLVADAARRARKLEELLLVGEMHAPVVRAVAQTKNVIELAHGLANALRTVEWAVIRGGGVVRGTAHHEQFRRGPAC